MSASLAVASPSVLLQQLESMCNEVQTPECRHWLEQELQGYAPDAQLPWYRIVPCRQRGHFLDLNTGRYLTCHIGSQTLCQRDLANVQFIYARAPAAHYLLHPSSGIEPWPVDLKEQYQALLIPGHLCLQAWHEPVSSLRIRLMEGIEHFISEYPKHAALQPQHSFKALQHSHWHI
ncbi:AbiTii domain-containing protein [Aeromonas rivuli]|uniref:AbiTii domain-containing protein n=1 Tax=Aeromonas rivuli TaxID=648794 RepID=UPI001CC960F4|nr:hypothetical protein [Aeromonas rivuli]UBO73863.1 hypothetical protein KYK33_19050 [Aeromonas rivuli]